MEKQLKKTARKSPQRDPIRKLFMEKARLEFDIRALSDKLAVETTRHNEAVLTINMSIDAKKTRIEDITAQLSAELQLEL